MMTHRRRRLPPAGTMTEDAPPFAVGTSVEARRVESFEDCDVLYYEAEVLSSRRAESGAVTYTLLFEDGTRQGPVPREWVKRNERRVVATRGHVRVLLGHADDHPGANPAPRRRRRVLLLTFERSPTLYQSAVALERHASPPHDEDPPDQDPIPVPVPDALVVDHRILPFEQHQCFALVVALAGGAPRTRTPPPTRRLSLVALGGGGCAFPASASRVFPALVDVVAVEIDEDVVAAARDHFDAVDGPNFRLVVGDAATHLNAVEDGSVDALVVDVADADADADADDDDEGLVLPPPSFASEAFLAGHARRCLRTDGGVCVLNALGGRTALRRLAATFRTCFPAVAVLCTDPNYLFFGFTPGGWTGDRDGDGDGDVDGDVDGDGDVRAPSAEEVVAAARATPGVERLCPYATRLARRSRENLEAGNLMGWMDVDTFARMLDDPNVVV